MVTDAFMGMAMVELVARVVTKSFLYCGSAHDVKYVGLLALWWLAGWCLVK